MNKSFYYGVIILFLGLGLLYSTPLLTVVLVGIFLGFTLTAIV